MALKWKHEFARELKISPNKLDQLMTSKWLEYRVDIVDRRRLIVDEDEQEEIKSLFN